MSRTFRLLVAVGAISTMLVAAVVSSAHRTVSTSASVTIPAFTAAQLLKDPSADFPTNLGNLYGTVHSSLADITPANVSNLKVAWHSELTAPNVSGAQPPQLGGSGAIPLAYNGVLYTEDAFDRVYATDATTGKNLWVYDPKLAPFGTVVPYSVRGLAIGDGKVFLAQGDNVLTAIDANTGQRVWSTTVAKLAQGLFFTAAPLYYDGMVLTGTSGGDSGGSCFFLALDSKTGKPLWHWNAIPTKKGHTGFDTWVAPKKRAWLGGGALWSTSTVDPKLGLVYVSVGNPIPYVLGRPPGMEVPTNAVVALHVKTGKAAWAYQTIHHDLWDSDMSNHTTLADITYKGKARHAIIAVNKNGYAYVLDRATGKPILPIPEVKVPQSKTANTWPTQPIPQGGAGELIKHTIDPAPWAGYTGPDGKAPFLASTTPYPPIDDTRYTVYVQPGLNAYQHNSYDPQRGLFFDLARREITIKTALPVAEVLPSLKIGNGNFRGRLSGATAGTPAAASVTIRLVAFDPAKNKVVWATEYDNNATTVGSLGDFTGMVSTKSGLIFVGRGNGYLEAYDSSNGKLLWTSPKLAAQTNGAPILFTVNGKETVGFYTGKATNVAGATAIGSELYAFQLP